MKLRCKTCGKEVEVEVGRTEGKGKARRKLTPERATYYAQRALGWESGNCTDHKTEETVCLTDVEDLRRVINLFKPLSVEVKLKAGVDRAEVEEMLAATGISWHVE